MLRKNKVWVKGRGKAEGLVEGKAVGLVEGKAVGLVEGEQIGLVKGMKESEQIVRKVAKNLKESGMAIDKISELTGLTVEEINELWILVINAD